MELKLKRKEYPDYTIGKLTVEDFNCYILEDPVRVLPKECPYTSKGLACKCKEKIAGKTAIPYGRYEIKWSYSPKFGVYLPELLNVPHFLGIRIHSGNFVTDTEGCLLAGLKSVGKTVQDSKKACNILFPILETGCKIEKVFIEIC